MTDFDIPIPNLSMYVVPQVEAAVHIIHQWNMTDLQISSIVQTKDKKPENFQPSSIVLNQFHKQ